MHAGCADAADLFLVHIQANGGAGGLFNAEQCRKGSIGTYAVVMTMGNYKAAVEANVARSAGGNSLKLGGYEVLLGYAVALVQHGEQSGFESVGCFGIVNGQAAYKYVQAFALHALAHGFAHLILGKVGEKIGNIEHGIPTLIAHGYFNLFAVCLHYNSVKGKGQRNPLIFLYAAVIMRFKQGGSAGLVYGVLLYVQARGVDMAAHYVHAVFKGLAAYNG